MSLQKFISCFGTQQKIWKDLINTFGVIKLPLISHSIHDVCFALNLADIFLTTYLILMIIFGGASYKIMYYKMSRLKNGKAFIISLPKGIFWEWRSRRCLAVV